MRGAYSISCVVGVVLLISLASRSLSSRTIYSARTNKRAVRRMVETSQRLLDKNDRSPLVSIAHYAASKTWAEAALAVASEQEINKACGVDVNHLIDLSQRNLDGAVLKARQRTRSRVRPDQIVLGD